MMGTMWPTFFALSAVQLAVPSFCNVRFKSCVVLLSVKVAPFATIVRPVPDISPDSQTSNSFTVTSPAPLNVPERRRKILKLTLPAKLDVPPLKLNSSTPI